MRHSPPIPRRSRRIVPRLAVTFVALGVFCASLAEDAPVFTTADGAIAGYDPVAYFTAGTAVRGSTAHVHTWAGEEWRFASEDNRARFAAEPERYAPQYGGHCSFAMAQGEFANIDPTAFEIVDGRLFLNNSELVHRYWQQERDSYIADADRRWQGIIDFLNR